MTVTVNHKGRYPRTDGRAAKNIEVNAIATFCLTCKMMLTKYKPDKFTSGFRVIKSFVRVPELLFGGILLYRREHQ